MPQPNSRQETMVLDIVRSVESLTIAQAITLPPDLSWSELFNAVDTLSRRGAIILLRRGFEYELRACSASFKGEPSDFVVETAC